MTDPSPKRLLILGAGPTGLGAAHRALESGLAEPLILERASAAGGLASSFRDDAGFLWDCGSHFQFSHYEYFDRALDEYIASPEWIDHERRTFVWLCDDFIPYPVQLHTDHLPQPQREACERGLRTTAGRDAATCRNFLEWMEDTQGPALCDLFMKPYNEKVWACDPESMSADWIAERVAVPAKRPPRDSRAGRRWGPNARFRYPRAGGAGFVWRRIADRLPSGTVLYGQDVCEVDVFARAVKTASGATFRYDECISTLPIPELTQRVNCSLPPVRRLRYTTTHVVGIGIAGQPPESLADWLWGYFPQPEIPFYRLTVLSNLSDDMTPGPGTWSVMVELAESSERPMSASNPCGAVVEALLGLGFVRSWSDILSKWHRVLPYGYPVPTIDRDQVVQEVLADLEQLRILSRGRFGAWKYEVSNQDHSFMQGVEAVDRILFGWEEPTLSRPNLVNAAYNHILQPNEE